MADGSDYGILADDVEQALINKDTSALEKTVTDFGKSGRPDAFTYWGKIVEHRLQDPTGALKWYTQAAENGDAEGAFYVARAYCEGKIVEPNPIECYKWLSISQARAKDPLLTQVTETLTIVNSQIAPEDKAEAQKQAAAFKPENERKQKSTFKLF